MLTWKCASCHNGVHFFNISTSKSAPNRVCFVHFDLEMCFVPHRPAIFQPLNFQNCSERGVFCNILTWKCASRHHGAHFFYTSTSKSAPRPSVFNTLTLKCASRHNGVHFFDISTSKRIRTWFALHILTSNALRATSACNFLSLIWPAGSAPAALASLLFNPPKLKIIGKTLCFAAFLLCRAPASSFLWLFLFSTSSFFFSSLTLPTSAFPSVHIVRSLTSKLPPRSFICEGQANYTRYQASYIQRPYRTMTMRAELLGWAMYTQHARLFVCVCVSVFLSSTFQHMRT